jgi:hypothetical protein
MLPRRAAIKIHTKKPLTKFPHFECKHLMRIRSTHAGVTFCCEMSEKNSSGFRSYEIDSPRVNLLNELFLSYFTLLFVLCVCNDCNIALRKTVLFLCCHTIVTIAIESEIIKKGMVSEKKRAICQLRFCSAILEAMRFEKFN